MNLFQSVATTELKIEKVEQGGKGKKIPAKETVSFDVNQILKDAKEWAEDDAIYLALIDRLEKKAKNQTRGPIGGTQYGVGYLYGNHFINYYVRFYPYQRAYIEINGATQDIDLFVYDSYGNLVVSGTRNYNNAAIYFTPNCDCVYTIKVCNRDYYATNYSITIY